MNQIEHGLKTNLIQAVKLAFDVELTLEDVVIEVPKLKEHGDYSTNVAMRLTKQLRSNPRMIAQTIMDRVNISSIEKMEIAGAGFINFFMKKELLTQVISNVLDQDDAYGLSSEKNGIKINVEYVSANPTGDLHPGHARGAAIGDSLTRIMKAAGYDVTREYYLNDAGNQINNMAKSLQARYLQHCGLDIAVPEDGYHGKDLIEIADDLYQEVKDQYFNKDNLVFETNFKLYNYEYNMIKKIVDKSNKFVIQEKNEDENGTYIIVLKRISNSLNQKHSKNQTKTLSLPHGKRQPNIRDQSNN